MSPKNKKRLLIVDDEEGIRESLALAFEIEGYPVFSACDGAEAWDKIQSNKIDIVISDIRMPKKDGIALLQDIRKLDPFKPTVLLMSAYTEFTEQDLKRMGASVLLRKPIDLDTLIGLVEEYN